MFGKILNIKPILTVDLDGQVAPVDKVRGTKKAMAKIIEYFGKDITPNEPIGITVGQTTPTPFIDELEQMMKDNFNVVETKYVEIGAVIGVHVGPQTVAIFVYR
jgi:DegV family protein with EDD domain